MLPYTLEIDAIGLNCPMPLLKLKKGLNEILTIAQNDNVKTFYIKKA